MALVLLYVVVLVLVAIVLFGLASCCSAAVSRCRRCPAGPRRRCCRRPVSPAPTSTRSSSPRRCADTKPARWTGCWTGSGQELDLLRGQLSSVHAAAAAGPTRPKRAPRMSPMTMSDDGLVRCDWAVGKPGSADFQLYRDYHDKEWGQPLRGQVPLFERMSLEAFQSGLSWLIILRKRENFRHSVRRFQAREGRPIHRRRRGPADGRRRHRPQPGEDRGDHRQRASRRRGRRPLRVALVVRSGPPSTSRDSGRRTGHRRRNPPRWHAS